MVKKPMNSDQAESYDDILNRTWAELPDEVILPDGVWMLTGRNAIFKPATEKGSAKVLFFYIAKEPIAVDEDLLEQIPADHDLSTNQVTYTVWLEKPSDWKKVQGHLALHGIAGSGTISEGLKQFGGSVVAANLGVRTFERRDGSTGSENTPSDFARVE